MFVSIQVFVANCITVLLVILLLYILWPHYIEPELTSFLETLFKDSIDGIKDIGKDIKHI